MAKDKLNNLLDFKEYNELKKFDKSTKRTEVGGDVVQEKKGCADCADKKGKKKGKREMPQFILDAIQKKKDRLAKEKGEGKKEEKPKKKVKHIKEFAEFDVLSLNEGVEFSNEFKQKAQAFVDKYRNTLVKVLAPFRNCKTEKEVVNIIQQKQGTNEEIGWIDIKQWISKVFGIGSTAVAGASMLSSIYGLYQLAQTNAVGSPLEYGVLGLLGAIVLYVVHLVFTPSNKQM